jgi:hypothetical protein
VYLNPHRRWKPVPKSFAAVREALPARFEAVRANDRSIRATNGLLSETFIPRDRGRDQFRQTLVRQMDYASRRAFRCLGDRGFARELAGAQKLNYLHRNQPRLETPSVSIRPQNTAFRGDWEVPSSRGPRIEWSRPTHERSVGTHSAVRRHFTKGDTRQRTPDLRQDSERLGRGWSMMAGLGKQGRPSPALWSGSTASPGADCLYVCGALPIGHGVRATGLG